MSAITFAEELRSRSDEDLQKLIAARADLIYPVPNDFASLAARASSMPSLLRAVDELNKWQIQILEAAAVLAEPFKSSELVEITDSLAKQELENLWQIGLLYKEGNSFRIPTNLRQLLGPEPANLGPSLLDDKLLSKLPDLNKAPAGTKEILEKLTWNSPRGSISDISKVSKPLSWLLENNYLIKTGEKTVALPREIGLKLRGGKAHRSLDKIPTEINCKTAVAQKIIDQSAIANISTVLRWVEELLHHLSDQPATALRTGGIGIRDLKRISEHIGESEEIAAFVCEISYLAGLVVVDVDEKILPTSAFDLWLTKNDEDKWYALVSTWIESARNLNWVQNQEDKKLVPLGSDLEHPGVVPIKKILAKILQNEKPFNITDNSLAQNIEWHIPKRANKNILSAIIRELEWLGITGQNQISTFGKNFFARSDDLQVLSALPKPVDHFLIQADNTAVAPGPLLPELSAKIGQIADIASKGAATVFKFSESSIRRGLDHGQTGSAILDFLKKHSKTAVPQPLEYLINDVSKRHGRLRIGSTHSYLRCEDESLIQQILHDNRCEHLRLRKIAPQVLVSDHETIDLLNELREFGYLPASENSSGVILNEPKTLRAKSRPRPPKAISEFNSPNQTVINTAIKSIRTGERSKKSIAPAPSTSANETLSILQQHIQNNSTLIISYADTNGGLVTKMIDPKNIALGTLLAVDHSTEQPIQFKISRIVGVSPAEVVH